MHVLDEIAAQAKSYIESSVSDSISNKRPIGDYGPHDADREATQSQVDIKKSISDAIVNSRKVEIVYSDYNNNESTRVITPTAWVDRDKFVAYCNLRKEERHFRVSRISRCSPK